MVPAYCGRPVLKPRTEYAVNGSRDTLDAGRPDATGELWPEGFITRRYSLAANFVARLLSETACG